MSPAEPARTDAEDAAGADRRARETLERVVELVDRAGQSAVMLGAVPIARTQAAERARDRMLLAVHEALVDDLQRELGLEPPVAPGQTALEVGA